MNLGDVGGKVGAQDDAGRRRRGRAARSAPQLHPAPLPHARSACSARSASRPPALLAGSPAAEVGAVPDGPPQDAGRSSTRPARLRCVRRPSTRTAQPVERRHAAHRAQTDGWGGLRMSTDEQGRIRSWTLRPVEAALRAAARRGRCALPCVRPGGGVSVQPEGQVSARRMPGRTMLFALRDRSVSRAT